MVLSSFDSIIATRTGDSECVCMNESDCVRVNQRMSGSGSVKLEGRCPAQTSHLTKCGLCLTRGPLRNLSVENQD